jgi:putative ABC transport system permease protein
MTKTYIRRSQSAALNRSASVSFAEILRMSIEALWSNKLRTMLTMLGIIIGITAVIAVTAIGQGTQKATEQRLQSLGTDILQVQSGAARSGAVRQGSGRC